jgi:hypothetical protein
MVTFNMEQLCSNMQIIFMKVKYSTKLSVNMINALKFVKKMFTMEA